MCVNHDRRSWQDRIIRWVEADLDAQKQRADDSADEISQPCIMNIVIYTNWH